MELFKWKEKYSIGLDTIDDQHKILVEMINDLIVAMDNGSGQKEIIIIIKKLSEYTQTHFKFEEELFTKWNYEHEAAHLEEHNSFVKKVSEFQKGLEAGTFGLSINVLFFLQDWLLKHINGSDKKYVELFQSNGMK